MCSTPAGLTTVRLGAPSHTVWCNEAVIIVLLHGSCVLDSKRSPKSFVCPFISNICNLTEAWWNYWTPALNVQIEFKTHSEWDLLPLLACTCTTCLFQNFFHSVSFIKFSLQINCTQSYLAWFCFNNQDYSNRVCLWTLFSQEFLHQHFQSHIAIYFPKMLKK